MKSTLKIAIIVFVLSLSAACEKTRYDLLVPESAGIWTLYSTETGLPSNRIKDITLDSRGNLWVTFEENGAAMYTDNSWSFYRTANSNILSNSVTSLATAADGSVIIGTTDGISILTASGDWTSYRDPIVSSMYINCARVTSNGWVWLGTENQGFYYDRGSGFEQINLTGYNDIRTIEEDNSQNVYLGTANGLLKWDGNDFISINSSDGLLNDDITALHLDRKNRLWIGASAGKTVTYLEDGEFRQISLMNGAPETNISDIFEDRSGNVWFATRNEGLIRYDGVISHSFKAYNGFFDNEINCIGEDKDGNLWFGINNKGLAKYTLPIQQKK